MSKEKKSEEVLPEPPKPEDKDNYVIREVATETTKTILDESTGEYIDIQAAIVKILNNQEKIMKGIL